MGAEEVGEVGERKGKETREEESAARKAPSAELPEMGEEEVRMVEEILGYEFTRKELVAEALTHGTFYFPYKPEVTYERLEFMGDAVLTCVIARHVFESYSFSPGPLTRLRAANVDTEKLARAAVGHGLHRFIRHKVPHLEGQIQDFMQAMIEYPLHSNGLVDPPKVLADIVESLLGAVFVDSHSSLDAVEEVYKRLAEPLISPETLGKHPVSELFEFCQKNKMQVTFAKDTWVENTEVMVLVDGNVVGSATYGQKKEIAQNRAAKVALDNLKESLRDLEPATTVHVT